MYKVTATHIHNCCFIQHSRSKLQLFTKSQVSWLNHANESKHNQDKKGISTSQHLHLCLIHEHKFWSLNIFQCHARLVKIFMNLTARYSYVTISKPTRSAGSGNTVRQVLKFKKNLATISYYDNISASGFVHSLMFVCVEIVGYVFLCICMTAAVRPSWQRWEGVGT